MAALDFSDGAIVALYPRENEARALAADGEQSPESLHVTLLYLGTAREALPLIELTQAVAGGIASKTEALAGTVGGVATFDDSGDGAPVVLLPDVPGLTELGTTIRDELARVGVESPSEHGFQPHLTISYGGDAEALEDRIGQPLHFDTLCVVVGSDRFEYPLQAPPDSRQLEIRYKDGEPTATYVDGHLLADHPQAPLTSDAPVGLIETEAEIQNLALRAQGLKGREAVLAALTAAGVTDAVEPTTTYDLSRERSLGERRFYAEVITAGYAETRRAAWPSEAELADHGEVLYRGNDEAVFRLSDETIVYAHIEDGWFHARFAAPSRSQSAEAVDAFAQAYPPLYAEGDDSGTVPITFWTNSQWGPVSRLRRIEASAWEAIEQNYAEAVHDELARIIGDDFEPGKDGQLLLWQGPPGTGKTWALRALASEWGDWAEFHYITDPDAFFVSNPSYMIDVLLSDSYEELTVEGDVLTSERGGKWKVLVLEDTGELLSANAKEAYGQGLSRLLNVVDGMVGQGLRVLAVVTTNDELGDMHPAATRPGRCASQIVFAPLSAAEASEWLGETVDEGGTLAELYARRGGAERAFEEDEPPEVRLAAAIWEFEDEQGNRAPISAAVATQPTNASQLRWSGVLMIEGEPTDDGRMIDPGAIDWRDLPLSLMAMTETGVGGHQGAFLAGRIDEIWRDGNLIMGSGVFDNSDDGREVARLVDERMLRGVSVDLAIRSYELRPKDDSLEQAEEGDLIDALLGEEVEMVFVVTDGSIGMATVCPFPAFADAEIALVASAPLTWRYTRQSAMTISECEAPATDSPSSEGEAATVVTASAAGLAPVTPPAEWFENPDLEEPTPLQVTEDGRVYGHAAVWDTCHLGFENACVLAPRSQTDYSYFHLGEVEVELDTDDLARIPCGTLTLDTGHADLRRGITRAEAIRHYDNTGTVAAHVVAGEDEHGIWFAGALNPRMSEEDVRVLRGAKISGDWRGEELIAMLAVNVPGFPVPRVRVASVGQEVVIEALVAAGVADRRVLDAARDRAETGEELPRAGASKARAEDLSERDDGQLSRSTLAEAALVTLASAHSRTVEAVERVFSNEDNHQNAERELVIARQALEVLETFAAREQPRPGDVHVHVPERQLAVSVEPAQAHVTVEAPPPTPAPQIDVHVPEQPAPNVMVAAPDVRVEVEAQKPRNIRVEEDADGTRRYISEED